MPRPQQFDRDDVLDRALSVFWRQGYEAASIQDLVDATGLNRGSLYNAFGDKAQLFAEVMERYSASSPVTTLIDAANPENGENGENARTLIRDFFIALVKRAVADKEHKGCLFTNTAAGFYGCSEPMSDWIRSALSGFEDALIILVKRGQQRREISATESPDAIARSLIASAQGLNVMARTGASTDQLKDIAAMALRVLNK